MLLDTTEDGKIYLSTRAEKSGRRVLWSFGVVSYRELRAPRFAADVISVDHRVFTHELVFQCTSRPDKKALEGGVLEFGMGGTGFPSGYVGGYK